MHLSGLQKIGAIPVYVCDYIAHYVFDDWRGHIMRVLRSIWGYLILITFMATLQFAVSLYRAYGIYWMSKVLTPEGADSTRVAVALYREIGDSVYALIILACSIAAMFTTRGSKKASTESVKGEKVVVDKSHP